MRSVRSWAACGLAFISAALASDVHDLKQDTFKDFVGQHDLVLAETAHKRQIYAKNMVLKDILPSRYSEVSITSSHMLAQEKLLRE